MQPTLFISRSKAEMLGKAYVRNVAQVCSYQVRPMRTRHDQGYVLSVYGKNSMGERYWIGDYRQPERGDNI